jgi:GTP-binding protein LepA
VKAHCLIVDAAQGIQAQTISNLYLALENDLTIIPILNKIDLPSADPELVKDQIVDLLGCEEMKLWLHLVKQDWVHDILAAIVKRIPAPKGDPEAPLQALIFDSVFNSFRGIIAYFRITTENKKGREN